MARHAREVLLTRFTMFLSLVAAGGFATLAVQHYLSAATIVTAATVAVFTAIIAFLIYGNLGYQLARLGYWQRVGAREQNIANSTQSFTKATAPSLTILVPAYKEEASVIRQTVLSAALQVYPQKRVVLLIDDPPEPRTAEDRQALEAARRVPVEIHALFAEPRQRLQEAYSAFLCRLQQGELEVAQEAISLAEQHRFAAAWFDEQADGYPADSHTDRWFIEHMLRAAREEHCMAAMRWESEAENSGYCDKLGQESMFEEEYGRLLSIFDVDLSSFERKQYRNLSHEPNKAMNLNSYLGLMGRRVRLVQRGGECELADSARGARAIDIPDTAYVITLDADSVLLRHYAETLIAWMEQPEHARIAVTQTPYSAFPDAPGLLEQTAGATTDIQYLVHQGFTRYGATFWVGANALLRKAALDDVCERSSDGWVCRYIQDHTVIEDTESTVDLLRHGWQLFNHPERLAYSATPRDFASLIIQRGRWANGGLLIIPKLLAYWRTIKASRQSLAQAFYQFHYLTSLALSPVCLLLLLLVPFPDELNTAWIPLAALPFCLVSTRDLRQVGYRNWQALFRVYALNLLLVPVHLGGALKSLQQAWTGQKSPFRRTPKVLGRTRSPLFYLLLEYAFLGLCFAMACLAFRAGQWSTAFFALGNGILLLYGLARFIGWREMWEDLRWTWRYEGPALPWDWLRQAASVVTIARPSPSSPPDIGTAVVLLTCLLSILYPTPSSGTFVTFIERENEKPGNPAWVLTAPAVQHEIEGYASRVSVNRGEPIKLFVNTTAPYYRLQVFRMGWYGGAGARAVTDGLRLPGIQQPAPHRDVATGLIECDWGHPYLLAIPRDPDPTVWMSGVYLVKLTTEPIPHDSYIIFVVRDDARASDFLFQTSVTTYQAYNNWGGQSLYAFNSVGAEQASQVSFNRPYAFSAVVDAASGGGAGDFLTTNSIPPDYPASPAGWEYNFVRWLEREGFDVAYTTNIDVHRDGAPLFAHAAFFSVGHDEYWSWQMRNHVELARDRGVHLAFFSANTCYWQIRLEPSGITHEPDRTIVAYKEKARWHDPLWLDETVANDGHVTTQWRNPPVSRPEADLLGVMYVESPVDSDFEVAEAEHWIFQQTGLRRGDVLPGLLGYEVDGVDGTGLDAPTVLARARGGAGHGAMTVYVAESGAMVFATGSMQWVWSLDDFHAPLLRPLLHHGGAEQMTRNLLEHFKSHHLGSIRTGDPS